jgi:outer membrane lipoprotein-sorting protein
VPGVLLVLWMSLGSAPGQQDALDVLSRVSRTYASMKTLQAEADVSMGTTAPGLTQNTSMHLFLALAPPGKMRIENKGPMSVLLIFDGQRGWMYMPALNKYSKLPNSATPAANAAASSSAGGDAIGSALPGVGFIPDFKNVAEGVKEARIVRSETLQVDGADVDCYVIGVVHKPQPPLTPQAADGATVRDQITRETVWVDKARDLVVRLTSDTIPVAAENSTSEAEIRSTITFHKLTLDAPLADDTFVFTPPAGATELDLTQFMPQSAAPAAAPPAP